MRYFNPGFVSHPPLFVGWNVNDKSGLITISGGLLTATSVSAGSGGVRATLARASGKHYCELSITTPAGGSTGVGLASADAVLTNIGAGTKAFIQLWHGNTNNNGSAFFSGMSINSGGVVGIAYDADAHLGWITVDGTHWNSSGGSNNPATGVGGQNLSAFDSSGLLPCLAVQNNGDASVANFGATSFSYTKPAGFASWNG